MPDVSNLTCEQILAGLEQKARDSWHGEEGERRAEALRAFLDDRLAHYAEHLGMPFEDVLRACESSRNYMAINYYQDANFPTLDGCLVLDSLDEFKARFPSGRFRCPACQQVSTDPYECNSGAETDGKRCDWKSYGLLRCLGKGLRVVVREDFLKSGTVHEIFMPIEAETDEAHAG